MIAKTKFKKNRKASTHNHRANRQAKRKREDAIAGYANRPNGGCFHSHYWVRKHIYEEKQLQKRYEELCGPCIIIRPANKETAEINNNRRKSS